MSTAPVDIAVRPVEELPAPPRVEADPYIGISSAAFPTEVAKVLAAPVKPEDVEIRPDGIVYLPEMKYRLTLNRAFGPGAWALRPVSFTTNGQTICATMRLYALGRFVAEATGEADYIENNPSFTYATAAESAKSNGMMRCCKDLCIASELWDPQWRRKWTEMYAVQVWCTGIGSRNKGERKPMWRRKDSPPIDTFPWREEGRGPTPKEEGPSRTTPDGTTSSTSAAKTSGTTEPPVPEHIRNLNIGLSKLGLKGRDAILKWISDRLGRRVTSSKEVSAPEAQALLMTKDFAVDEAIVAIRERLGRK